MGNYSGEIMAGILSVMKNNEIQFITNMVRRYRIETEIIFICQVKNIGYFLFLKGKLSDSLTQIYHLLLFRISIFKSKSD